MTGIQIFMLAGGVITEIWGCFDARGAMQQLGATLTMPGQATKEPEEWCCPQSITPVR